MKGIILAGGHATRLRPTTQVINKHLLNIYDKPMIFGAIETLRDAGITDIVITLGDHDTDRFFDLLGDGSELGVNIDYHYHGPPKGIAYAIFMCHDRVRGEPFVVLLGDNLFCDGLEPQVRCFKNNLEPMVVLKKMSWEKAKNYGVAVLDGASIVDIVEKPKEEISRDVILGSYFLDKTFFDFYKNTSPSQRGEYEITEVLKQMTLTYSYYGGRWFDLGSFEDILEASLWRREQTR